jgi:hypothetical protein
VISEALAAGIVNLLFVISEHDKFLAASTGIRDVRKVPNQSVNISFLVLQ